MSLLSIATAPVSEQPAAQGAAGSKLLQRRHSTSPRGQHRRSNNFPPGLIVESQWSPTPNRSIDTC